MGHPGDEQLVGPIVQAPDGAAFAALEGQHAERHAGGALADQRRGVFQRQPFVRLAPAHVGGQRETVVAGIGYAGCGRCIAGAGRNFVGGHGGWRGGKHPAMESATPP